MGICASKDTSEDAVVADAKSSSPAKTSDAAAAAAAPSSDSKPKPMIFAIMRNGHEVIRDGVKEFQSKLRAAGGSGGGGGDLDDVAKYWMDLHRWLDMHKLLEEGKNTGSNQTPKGFFLYVATNYKITTLLGSNCEWQMIGLASHWLFGILFCYFSFLLFSVLDEKCGGAATNEGLFEQHQAVDKMELSMTQAVKKKNLAMMNAEIDAFAKLMEEHLKKEEDVMMPKVQQMKKDGVPLKKIMRDEILALIWKNQEDWEFFVEFACGTLAKRPMIQPLRVFCFALYGIATPTEWKHWSGYIQKVVSDGQWKEMEPLFTDEWSHWDTRHFTYGTKYSTIVLGTL